MTEALRPDLCIVGAGPGGLAAAGAAALFGVPVVLVDNGPPAGEGLRASVLAAKMLATAAAGAHAGGRARLFGLDRTIPYVDSEADLPAIHEGASQLIDRLARNDSPDRLQALGVHLIRSEASFVDPHTVRAGSVDIKARRFILATRSRPAVPAIPGLESVAFRTPDTILQSAPGEAAASPLVILGASSAGLELAQAYGRLGARVFLLDVAMPSEEHFFSNEDPEIAAIATTALAREGIDIILHAEVERIEQTTRDGTHVINVHLRGQANRPAGVIEARGLVVTAGRQPVLEGLNLHLGGIGSDETGIRVDRSLRTSNRHVYAVGECIGGVLAHQRLPQTAEVQAGLAIRSALFRLPVRADAAAIPRVTFTDPEIASVGLCEDEARRRHRAVRVVRWPFFENDRAQAEHATEGHIKAVATGSGRILGASIVGPQAGELIAPWALALAKGMKLTDLASLAVAYPTFAEVSKRAAVSYLAAQASDTRLRWLLRFLRFFG